MLQGGSAHSDPVFNNRTEFPKENIITNRSNERNSERKLNLNRPYRLPVAVYIPTADRQLPLAAGFDGRDHTMSNEIE